MTQRLALAFVHCTDLSLAEEDESRFVLQVGVRDDVVDLSGHTVHLVVLAAKTDELGVTDDLAARGRGLGAGDHILWKAGKTAQTKAIRE